jgi:hypothetical protein
MSAKKSCKVKLINFLSLYYFDFRILLNGNYPQEKAKKKVIAS